MKRVFFIVGPTATGKSEIAAEIACQLDAEIVSADAFQIYRGLDLLVAKPEKTTLEKVPHHLLSAVPLDAEMNVEKFRATAVKTIRDIHARKKPALVVGGSGLYVRALTHGLSPLPGADPKLRAQLNKLSLEELRRQLVDLDPESARKVDLKNRRRVVRALEICLLSGKPVSKQRGQWAVGPSLWGARPGQARRRGDCASHSEAATLGVFVFRERRELYQRI